MLRLAQECVLQSAEAFTDKIPNAAFPVQETKEAANSAGANMIVVQDQLIAVEREVRLEISVLHRTEIVGDIIVRCERQDHLIDLELFGTAQVKQILLICA